MVSIAPWFLLKSWFLAPISLSDWFLLRNKSKNDNTVKSQILAHPRPHTYLKRGKMYININIFPTSLRYIADLSSFISYSSSSLTTPCPSVFCYSQSLVSWTLQALFCSFPLSFSPFLLLYSLPPSLPPSSNPAFLSLACFLFSAVASALTFLFALLDLCILWVPGSTCFMKLFFYSYTLTSIFLSDFVHCSVKAGLKKYLFIWLPRVLVQLVGSFAVAGRL